MSEVRRPFRDNPRLILAGIALLLGALVVTVTVAKRSSQFSPDFNTEFILYALTAVDLTILVGLAFVLARNVVKLVVERRRGRPFARFRGKLVTVLLGMTLVPAVLVLAVGSEVIRTSVDGWFNAPMDDILASANQIAGDYYHERQLLAADEASRLARMLAPIDLTGVDPVDLRQRLTPAISNERVQVVEIYRVANGPVEGGLEPFVDVSSATVAPGYSRADADRLAALALTGGAGIRSSETVGPSGDLLHAATIVKDASGRATGAVVVTEFLTSDLVARSRRMTQAYESYNQLRVLKRPLTGVYLLFFLMVTLMILIGAVWMGLYLAKRITRPVQMLATAAREIGAGRLDQHLEPQSDDEFGALTEAFNTMAGELASSRRAVERSTVELERKHFDVERRRRYVETILERVTTGVLSLDAQGIITTINSAASRLLGLERSVIGQRAQVMFQREDLQPLASLLSTAAKTASEPVAHDLVIAREGQELHLAIVATALLGERGADGQILVLDDVTPLVRTQRVAAWREVARRLAHEIKNPLTPIQLSAERLKRHFADAPSGARALVDECTTTIVGEVESLKGLVDEFSQFARMPPPRTVLTDLHDLIRNALALYDGLFHEVTIEHCFGGDVRPVRVDPEQIRRVIINLVDNAIEAMERRGRIVVETKYDESNQLVRICITDDGPGIPLAERDKLFLPYYSTKGRGSGLGLAIVRRIIAEHGEYIEAGDHVPQGTRFTIELPS